jgi:hypothetical protein
MTRAQSHVVGVALLLGLTVLALGSLTVGVGTLLDAQAAAADTERVADGFARSLQPQQATGHHAGSVSFTDGRLATRPREVTLRKDGRQVEQIHADALVYESGDRRVTFLGGAIVRGSEPNTWFRRDPLVAASPDGDVLVVSVASLGDRNVAVAGGGGGRLRLETNVTHRRRPLGNGTFSLSVETAVPTAYERYFARTNTTTRRVDRDGDGVPSVVATYPDTRTAYLVRHNLSLEVGNG